MDTWNTILADNQTKCPRSLRRLAGKDWGNQVSARNSAFLSTGSFDNLPSVSTSMTGFLDPINKYAVGGECSSKLK